MPEPIKRTTTEARGGSKIGVTRWVLGISLILVIVAFALAFRAYAPS